MQITVDKREISFHVEYSKRKKMILDVTTEGFITIKVPQKTPDTEIEKFVKSNSKDLIKYLDKIENKVFISNKKQYEVDETFLYMGKACTLSQILDIIPESKNEVQAQLEKFYTKNTKSYINKRLKHFEKLIGVKSKSVTITDSKVTWGTCNNRKELTFNYRLSMAPPQVIDYVIIHELCHILHLNHDRSFWRKLGSYDPDFKSHQDYLAQFGSFMTI